MEEKIKEWILRNVSTLIIGMVGAALVWIVSDKFTTYKQLTTETRVIELIDIKVNPLKRDVKSNADEIIEIKTSIMPTLDAINTKLIKLSTDMAYIRGKQDAIDKVSKKKK